VVAILVLIAGVAIRAWSSALDLLTAEGSAPMHASGNGPAAGLRARQAGPAGRDAAQAACGSAGTIATGQVAWWVT